MTVVKPALHIHGEQITAPVSPEVQTAMERWTERSHAELVDILAPFGMHPYDIAMPEFRQVVYLPADDD